MGWQLRELVYIIFSELKKLKILRVRDDFYLQVRRNNEI